MKSLICFISILSFLSVLSFGTVKGALVTVHHTDAIAATSCVNTHFGNPGKVAKLENVSKVHKYTPLFSLFYFFLKLHFIFIFIFTIITIIY